VRRRILELVDDARHDDRELASRSSQRGEVVAQVRIVGADVMVGIDADEGVEGLSGDGS
jgi:hypothetical protein